MKEEKIIIGKFGSPHGIKGWIRINSFTEPKENIFNYSPWWINKDNIWQTISPVNYQLHGKNIIAQLINVNTPELAKTYTNIEINISHEQLPKLTKNEYYWSELEGLTVINQNNKTLGIVDHLLATGAHDVLVIKGEKQYLIPYINNVILTINLDNKTIKVDWEA